MSDSLGENEGYISLRESYTFPKNRVFALCKEVGRPLVGEWVQLLGSNLVRCFDGEENVTLTMRKFRAQCKELGVLYLVDVEEVSSILAAQEIAFRKQSRLGLPLFDEATDFSRPPNIQEWSRLDWGMELRREIIKIAFLQAGLRARDVREHFFPNIIRNNVYVWITRVKKEFEKEELEPISIKDGVDRSYELINNFLKAQKFSPKEEPT